MLRQWAPEDKRQNIADVKKCKLGWKFDEWLRNMQHENGLIRVKLLFITYVGDIIGDK